MEENNKGYVYILTNPSFREDWVKIGKSSRSVDVRSKELDNTAIPLPFEIYATLKTSKFDKVEYQGRLWSLCLHPWVPARRQAEHIGRLPRLQVL